MDLNPITVLVNISKLFLPGMRLAWLIAGVFGLWIGWKALSDAYKHVKGEQDPGMMPKGAILPVLFLAGACVVLPTVLWMGGNQIVLGGNQTASMFSYLETTNTSNMCSDVMSNVLTKFCMLMGTITVFVAFTQAYSCVSQPGRGHSLSTPIVYFFAGVCLFFINDVFQLASNTMGAQIGFSAICNALDGSKGG